MLKKITENVEIHQTLPDTPNLTSEELKKEWDKGNKIIKEKFNELIDSLNNAEVSELKDKINNLSTYSEEEIKTGEYWIDGKPIYRKVITTTPTNTESNVVEHNISNVDKIWISDKSFLYVGGTSLPVNYYRDTNTFIWAHINGGSYQYKISAPGWLNHPIYLIVEYTKTTD